MSTTLARRTLPTTGISRMEPNRDGSAGVASAPTVAPTPISDGKGRVA